MTDSIQRFSDGHPDLNGRYVRYEDHSDAVAAEGQYDPDTFERLSINRMIFWIQGAAIAVQEGPGWPDPGPTLQGLFMGAR